MTKNNGFVREAASELVRWVGNGESLHAAMARTSAIHKMLRPSPYPLHTDKRFAPFFIVGSGRCGTTLLRRILQGSPDVHIPPENWKLGRSVELFRLYRWLLPWDLMVHLIISLHEHQSERWFKTPPTPLIARLLVLTDNQRSLSHIIHNLYCYHGRQCNATFERWGDKTPLNIRYMDDILSVFPDARFINMVRDGVDVAHSWVKQGNYRDVIEPAQRWKNAILQARLFHKKYPDNMLDVKYENLVSNPTEVVSKISGFLHIEYNPEMVIRTDQLEDMQEVDVIPHYRNVIESIFTKSIGKGRRNISDSQKATLKQLIEDELINMGYEPIS